MKELIEKLEQIKQIDLAKNQVKIILTKEEIDQAIQALSQSEWISVEDRLPEINYASMSKQILSHSDLGLFALNYYDFELKRFTSTNYIGNITHWQPLPTPPNE